MTLEFKVAFKLRKVVERVKVLIEKLNKFKNSLRW